MGVKLIRTYGIDYINLYLTSIYVHYVILLYSIVYMIVMINLLTDLILLLVTNTYDFICILPSNKQTNDRIKEI